MVSLALLMKRTLIFLGHALLAMVGPMLLVVLMGVVEEHWFHRTPGANGWLDAPYSPILWGAAFTCGLLVNRTARHYSAQWVWIIGVSWLAVLIIGDVTAYNPRSCNGCPLVEYLWDTYFNYWDCTQECMGQLLGTAPMLSSIAYSLGAATALKVSHSAASEIGAAKERF